MRRAWRWFGGLLLLLAGGQAAAQVARYDLRAGDWLVYERRSETRGIDGAVVERSAHQVQFWVLRRHADGMELMLEVATVVDGKAASRAGGLLTIDDRGRRTWPPAIEARMRELDPALELLPQMRPATETAPEWLSNADALGRRWRYRQLEGDLERASISFALEDPVLDVLGRGLEGRIVFDRVAGRVASLEAEMTDARAGHVTRIATTLRGAWTRPEDWRRRRIDETQRYVTALRGEERRLNDIDAGRVPGRNVLESLDRGWSGFMADLRAGSGDSPLQAWVAARVAALRAEQPALEARLRLAASWIGRPAPDWSLQDGRGRQVRSDAQREVPCVELFWRSEDEACLRVLVQLSEQWATLEGRPVNIVCVNIDRDLPLAAAAAERCAPRLVHAVGGEDLAPPAAVPLPVARLVVDGRVTAVSAGWKGAVLESLGLQVEALRGAP